MRLSQNFMLDEFLVSQTAARRGIDMTPDDMVKMNLQRLCVQILQPVREELDEPVIISSGYRPRELNTIIGGSINSAHMTGRAADIVAAESTPLVLATMIKNMQLPFDQLILEFGRWVHVGIAFMGEEPRGEILTAYKSQGRTMYAFGLTRQDGRPV